MTLCRMKRGLGRRRPQPHELALARLERERQARRGGQWPGPHARGQHDGPRRDDAGASLHPRDPAVADEDRVDAAARPHLDARLPRHRPRDLPRRALEVAGEERRAQQRARQLRLALRDLVRPEQLRAHARRPQPLHPHRLA